MTDGPYFLGFDGGTESMRVGIFDREGTPITFAAEPYALKHPHPGWAEQDPAEWWACLVAAMRKAISLVIWSLQQCERIVSSAVARPACERPSSHR